MNLSAPFINRKVGTALLTAAVAIAGSIAFIELPVGPLPQVDFPTISVQAGLPGASAQIMAASVATPLERQFSHIAGITEMTSSSSLGSTQVTIQFDLSRDIDGAARDVQAAINAARTYLPANLPSNPSYRKVNPSDAPVMMLSLTSDKYATTELYDVASTVLAQKLSQIQGVGQVQVGGGATPSVRVEVDPTKLESFGLTLGSVQSVVRLQNSHSPRGQLSDNGVTEDILDNNQISTAAEYAPLIVGTHNGQAIRLSDVGSVTDSTQNIRAVGYVDGLKGAQIIISRQPGANIIDTVNRIKAQLPFLQAVLPQGAKMTVMLDRTTTIRASVGTVEQTLITAIVLVVLVVFLFLRSPRATIIPGVVVPVALVGTFTMMYMFDYTVDNLSLMALTIATAFVVDDAIVVMENIIRHIEDGLTPFDAALKGASEIGFTIFSISMSLIAVFIPLLMMSGIVGRLFREFAVTLSIAIVLSMVISLTTTPCLCAHVLKERKPGEKHNWIYNANEKFFNTLTTGYRHSLSWILDNPGLILIVLFLTVALNGVVIFRIQKGFFPQQDTGAVFGGLQGPQDASFPYMDFSAKTAVDIAKSDPAVDHVNASAGFGNNGMMYMSLKPLGKGCKESPTCNVRQTSAMDIINRLRPKLNRMPIASIFLQPAQDLRIGGRGGNSLYQYTIQSDNIDDLSHWGDILLQNMKRIPDLTDVNSNQQNGGLQELLTYDRSTAARLGQTASSLDNSLYSAFGQSEVSVIYKQQNQYYVVMEVAPPYWQDPSALNNIYFQVNRGTAAGINSVSPLSTVIKAKTFTTPLQVSHTGLFPSVTVGFNLRNGVSLSDATRDVVEMENRLGMPATVRGFFSGTAQAYQDSISSLPILGITAILSVFIMLGILYESMIHPLTIISTIPSASVGAMLALMLFHMDLNMISIIGIMLLIGLVMKNAILMVDFALQAERNEGKTTREAIFQACILRFRPITMTTVSAICGALPLAFGTGTGSELRKPLGITIVGGLVLSQLLTLYTTPVVYLMMDRLRRVDSRQRGTLPATAQRTAL